MIPIVTLTIANVVWASKFNLTLGFKRDIARELNAMDLEPYARLVLYIKNCNQLIKKCKPKLIKQAGKQRRKPLISKG